MYRVDKFLQYWEKILLNLLIENFKKNVEERTHMIIWFDILLKSLLNVIGDEIRITLAQNFFSSAVYIRQLHLKSSTTLKSVFLLRRRRVLWVWPVCIYVAMLINFFITFKLWKYYHNFTNKMSMKATGQHILSFGQTSKIKKFSTGRKRGNPTIMTILFIKTISDDIIFLFSYF